MDSNVPYGTIPSYNSTTPAKEQTAQYTYTFAGWSKTDDNTVDADALTAVTADRNVYACFTQTLRKYTVTFVRASADGGGTLQTINNVEYGTFLIAASSYTGSTPTSTKGSATDYPFEGWNPANVIVQGDTVFTAKFGLPVEVAEITDSWDTIIANIDNGTYLSVYKVGNYKPLDLGTEGTINMQIVAIDADELADGSGTAPLTFLGMELLNNPAQSYTAIEDVDSGWAVSAMRTYLTSTIKPLIPASISSRLQRVNKTYTAGSDTRSTFTSVDTLWCPSYREMFGNTTFERSGASYDRIYSSNDSRKKHRSNKTNYTTWFSRTCLGNSRNIVLINYNGESQNTAYAETENICLGFCLGLEPETITDDWSTILANSSPSTSYSIGDTKYLDLGAEGKHLMEIVGIDVDDRADGQGKAGLTWISKTLLNTTHRMNPANSSGAIGTGGNGGWLNCEIRTYLKETIKPLIPATVRNGIVEVTKIQSTVTDGTMVKDGQTSTEDIWIPSVHEVFSTDTTYETTGATYTKFATNTDRVKKTLSGAADGWWLRSASGPTVFRRVGNRGVSGSYDAGSAHRVALGFCTN